jgi:hypothetical protein
VATAEPLASPMPIDGDEDLSVSVAKKPRLEVPLLTSPTIGEAASSHSRGLDRCPKKDSVNPC